jgi:hypothetical protein
MPTKFRDAPLSEYAITAVALAETGYNYYLYVHARGDAIVMRENTAGTEYRYANAATGTQHWAARATLTYVTYNDLA